MNITIEEASANRSLLPEIEPWPDALYGGTEALEDDFDPESFWSRLFPSDIPFFELSFGSRLIPDRVLLRATWARKRQSGGAGSPASRPTRRRRHARRPSHGRRS